MGGGGAAASLRSLEAGDSARAGAEATAAASAVTARVLQHAVSARPGHRLRALTLPTRTLALTGRSFPSHLQGDRGSRFSGPPGARLRPEVGNTF